MIQKRIICDQCGAPIKFGKVFIVTSSKGFSSITIDPRDVQDIAEILDEVHICSVGCLLRYISETYTSQKTGGEDNEEV